MVTTISSMLPYLVTRMTEKGQVYLENNSLVLREHAGATHEGVSWLVLQPSHFGTYEWQGSIERTHANVYQFLGLIEKHHGWASEGGIFLEVHGSNYYLSSGDNYPTTLAGQDWTKNRTFKIEWSPSIVKLYVDGVLVGVKTVGVLQEPGNLFAEIYVPDGVTTTTNLGITIKNLIGP